MATLKNGILIDPQVHQRIYPGLEKGHLPRVHALVIHQTGAPTAQHTFNSYQNSGHGAHFLIDKSGTIYQTAHLNRKAHHVGKIKSKCYETRICSKIQLQAAATILFQKGVSYSAITKNLHDAEKIKTYPDRYPLNEDSIGIEIVGNYNTQARAYESVSAVQNQSLQWLLGELFGLFKIAKADVYRHPEVSYKTATEASTATW